MFSEQESYCKQVYSRGVVERRMNVSPQTKGKGRREQRSCHPLCDFGILKQEEQDAVIKRVLEQCLERRDKLISRNHKGRS